MRTRLRERSVSLSFLIMTCCLISRQVRTPVKRDSLAHLFCIQALLIQLDVKECVMQDDAKRTDIDLNKLREVIERCNVVLTERKSG